MLSIIKAKRKDKGRKDSEDANEDGDTKKSFLGGTGRNILAGISKQLSLDHKLGAHKEAEENILIPANIEIVMRPSSAVMTSSTSMAPAERPPSRSRTERPASRQSLSSVAFARQAQPKLGVTGISHFNAASYLFDDDPGIMSEVETASTRFRRVGVNQHASQPARPSSRSGRHSRASPSPASSHDAHLDDPGIMSEAETSSTSRSKRAANRASAGGLSGVQRIRNSIPMGALTLYGRHENNDETEDSLLRFGQSSLDQQRRGRKQKPVLPVVRTPSKTLERPLGVVFLIYRGETMRALLPNEITSIDTVKALFVRAFGPKTLTMEYMDLPRVRIYIHDAGRDAFDELTDLGDIRDSCVLKVFEADSSGRGPAGLGPAGLPPISNPDEFGGMPSTSEPTYVDSSVVKANKMMSRAQRELLSHQYDSETSSTLPRNAFSSLLSPPEGGGAARGNASLGVAVERSKTLGPGLLRGHRRAIESGYVSSPDGNYDPVAAMGPASGAVASRFGGVLRSDGRAYLGPSSTEEAKARMMHMEAQLSQLTGMVEKALKHKRFAGKKQVSFDKSVTIHDDSLNNHQQPQEELLAQPQATQPKSILSTPGSKRERDSSRDRSASHRRHSSSSALSAARHSAAAASAGSLHNPELCVQLRRLHGNARELRQEVKVLRRLTQLQSMAMRDLVQDTYLKLREACILFSAHNGLLASAAGADHWKDETLFSQELDGLLLALAELESKVEDVRSGVINKKSKIMLQEVEGMAVTLSQCSKTVTQLRQAYPVMEANLRAAATSSSSGNRVNEFLRCSHDNLDRCWRRCKKLTGTLVTLKRLASVQEQRFHPNAAEVSLSPTPPIAAAAANSSAPSTKNPKDNNSLDELLDALQTYTSVPGSKREASRSPLPTSTSAQTSTSGASSQVLTARVKPQPQMAIVPATARKDVVPDVVPPQQQSVEEAASASTEANPGPVTRTPPCPPPRTTTAAPRGAPPPPPPRTSSAKPNQEEECVASRASASSRPPPPAVPAKPASLVSAVKPDVLEARHQELLNRQKTLQEQFIRLQEMQQKSSASSKSNGHAVAVGAGATNGNGNHALAASDASVEDSGSESALPADPSEDSSAIEAESALVAESAPLASAEDGAVEDSISENIKADS